MLTPAGRAALNRLSRTVGILLHQKRSARTAAIEIATVVVERMLSNPHLDFHQCVDDALHDVALRPPPGRPKKKPSPSLDTPPDPS